VERARAEYPFLTSVSDSRFFHKPSIGFPLKRPDAVETWDTIKFMLEG
jgi:hypothetical protein